MDSGSQKKILELLLGIILLVFAMPANAIVDSTDNKIQQKLDEVKIELEIFHNLICRKEELMSGNVESKISNDELRYISEQLGYGKVREQILEEQSRNKKVK